MNAALDLNNYERQSKVGYLISRARAKLIETVNDELAQFDISAAQYFVISMLALRSAETTAQLCKESSYDTGAMTRMVDRLEKKGLLRRKRSSDDRRTIHLHLTEKGEALGPALQTCSNNVTSRLLHGFSQSETEEFEKLLEKFLANS